MRLWKHFVFVAIVASGFGAGSLCMSQRCAAQRARYLGELLSGPDLREAEENLKRLGIFEEVQTEVQVPDILKGSSPADWEMEGLTWCDWLRKHTEIHRPNGDPDADQEDDLEYQSILIRIKRKPTGSFFFTGGVTSTGGLIGEGPNHYLCRFTDGPITLRPNRLPNQESSEHWFGERAQWFIDNFEKGPLTVTCEYCWCGSVCEESVALDGRALKSREAFENIKHDDLIQRANATRRQLARNEIGNLAWGDNVRKRSIDPVNEAFLWDDGSKPVRLPEKIEALVIAMNRDFAFVPILYRWHGNSPRPQMCIAYDGRHGGVKCLSPFPYPMPFTDKLQDGAMLSERHQSFIEQLDTDRPLAQDTGSPGIFGLGFFN